jgi:hypothetical protein
MAKLLTMPRPDDYKRAHQRIKKLWVDGFVEISHHAQLRMRERKIDINDIANVIRYGQVIEHSKPLTLWRYTIAGKGVDGDRMRCVCEINGNLVIVSVI